jgi:hypothetical protein
MIDRISRPLGQPSRHLQGGSPRNRTILTAAAALGLVALGGCSNDSIDCSGGGVYRGGCMSAAKAPAGTIQPVTPSAAPVAPAPARPEPPPAAVAPVTIPRGDPSTFADIDDKQCRSYGLTFGSHDYADCRIRLSAQHRGLDPNIGSPTPAGK